MKRPVLFRRTIAGFCFWLLATGFALAAEIDATRKLLVQGKYDDVVAAATAEIGESSANAEWPLLLSQALTQLGRYADAQAALGTALENFPYDLRLRLAACEAARHAGDTEQAEAHRSRLNRLGGSRQWAYRSPADRVALGRAALILGAEPKQVLDMFFDPVRKEHPDFRESYLASGELALEKNDYALAAKTFGAAAKKFTDDPDIWFGLAAAYEPSDTEAMLTSLAKALEHNPNHIPAWLLLADHYIDAESYTQSDTAIAAALKVNAHHPEAHAYRAVLAHLRADEKAEKQARAAALKPWSKNPKVPHLIGRKLSQKYRFTEGAALQREALRYDPAFLPAKAQLANDLLRLGQDEEGWKLAEEVQKADPYDVVAYNLTTLRDAMAQFRTLTSEHFTVRMDAREAEIYGDKVLALLERAHSTLTKKYGLEPRERTIVEIFPDQKDFAIRTFGLPGGSGYLGVCFGRVITANSPASRPGSPSNWQAVLWHEFAHVVTLTLTKNKMPRWLSEGISVYEERQARGSWGEQMKPRYRAMILSEDLTPVSQLSGAFLKPKTAMHLGFAYYESSLVVEWLIERWGIDKVKRLLADLGRGVAINTALATHFAPIEKLDAEFAAHAQVLAKNTAPKLDWTKPKPSELASEEATQQFIAKNPNNFTALLEQARKLLEEKNWQAAKAPLEKLIELYPNQHDPDTAYALLARAHRELGETEQEIAVLSRIADLSADATHAYQRLMELAAERKEWAKVLEYAERYHAVDPLRPHPHRFEAEAQEAIGRKREAIAAYRVFLQLGAPNPPEIQYRLARLLHSLGDPGAKRHVLAALEEAPRFRDAHRLLLEIAGEAGSGTRVKAAP